MSDFIRSYQELEVYQLAFKCSTHIFQLSRQFPAEERILLTRQALTASRLVCTGIAQAWGQRRYRQTFIAKLSDAQAEAAEMQTWVLFAVQFGYLKREAGQKLLGRYRLIFAALDRLIDDADVWIKPVAGDLR